MPKEAKIGPFSRVRADSHIGRIVKTILDSSRPVTVSEVGTLVGLTAEQVVGFYLVESDDEGDLRAACERFASRGEHIELRRLAE